MSIKSLKGYSSKVTPQSEPIPGSDQVANSAGGYAFAVDDWGRLDRFLILGSEGPTYYISAKALTKENAEAVIRCIKEDGARVVNRIVEISDAGRAPKNDPAIFALALCASVGDLETRKLAFAAVPDVCRIGTHLFHFTQFCEQFRGWGKGLKKAIANWYSSKETKDVAFQAVKYQQRDGWSHRDLLRLSHPKPESTDKQAVYNWITQGTVPDGSVEGARPILGFEAAKTVEKAGAVVKLIEDYRLPREAIPTEWLKDKAVWEALLTDMPMTAMIRNLSTMTRVGLLAPLSDATRIVVERLGDQERLRKARVHPIAVLAALTAYSNPDAGRRRSRKTAGTEEERMEPVASVIDALDKAFYLTFQNVEPTGKRILLALDVSGSMSCGEISGVPGLTPRVGSAALALVTAATEKNRAFVAFTAAASGYGGKWGGGDSGISTLSISPHQRLDDVVRKISSLDFGGTDCALPMLWALEKGVAVDAFVILTDNETWAGKIHPVQALQKYRSKTGIPAKLIVTAMTSNSFSIADPKDAGMLDVVGFDTAVPNLMSDFIRG